MKAPSTKWIVAQVTALAALAVLYFETGNWDDEETIMGVGILAQAIISYLVPNSTADVRRMTLRRDNGVA